MLRKGLVFDSTVPGKTHDLAVALGDLPVALMASQSIGSGDDTKYSLNYWIFGT